MSHKSLTLFVITGMHYHRPGNSSEFLENCNASQTYYSKVNNEKNMQVAGGV